MNLTLRFIVAASIIVTAFAATVMALTTYVGY
ncbi:hypothetical protein Selin_2479 [Desulfurispirillum indicum S5]|uniref:Uncharacterized protein n=1 Tax=Desulfurispirillum indicum (strain ATCC BAA-1389 / DSM 22839 / S5) TaxID=653733 RepID=E6W5B5_DESIS|nr:hypothetical protein Selin_2479 [Desulfurispirillum indicum S5]